METIRFVDDCPICRSEMYPSEGNENQIYFNLIVLPCGHSMHVSCAQESDEIARITQCFFCAKPFNHNLIPAPPPAPLLVKRYQFMVREYRRLSEFSVMVYEDTYHTVPDVTAGATAAAAIGVGISLSVGVVVFFLDRLDTSENSVNNFYKFVTMCGYIVFGSFVVGGFTGSYLVECLKNTIFATGALAAANVGRAVGESRPVRIVAGTITALAVAILFSVGRSAGYITGRF
jgi:hypothetical protein